jgi:pSer/pThr/pTyr-binding forkhead associated (FHA) protein
MTGSPQPRAIVAPAYLVRLTKNGEPANAAPLSLVERELTFGTDPVQSKVVLDDPTLAPMHARIKRSGEDDFTIHDNGSVAGTWVNYEPVTREGVRLKHGDRVQLGGLIYRFDLHQPPAESEPKVLPVQ